MLALQFSCPSVEALQETMSYRDFVGWQMYYNIEPFGAKRDDLRAAIIARTTANLWSKKQYKIDDFMPKFGKPKEMGWEQMKNILKGMVKK